ncbi:MAG: quinone oxidoreductase family protein [Myxococcota bacterium]
MPHAIRIHEHGGPEVLRWQEVDVGEPGPLEVRLRQTAIGVNFIDTYHRTGLYPLPSLPHGIGQEAAGVIEAVGDNVSGLGEGDRVTYAGAGGPGSYAETRVVPADRVVKLPDGIDDETAAAMMLKGMTVEYLVRRCFPVREGQTVLWHAAAGGVGLLACQWLKHLGATVLGTVGSDEKAELARAHGCDHTIVYTREDFVSRVHEITGGAGVPVVYDSVGRATFPQSLDCLQPRGLFVGFGNASGKPDPFDMGLLAHKGSLYVTRPTLFTYNATREELLQSAQALFEVVQSGVVKVEINQHWPLANAADCHRALESRETSGSTVLTTDR